MALHIRIIDACNMIIKRNIYFALKIRRNAKGERLKKKKTNHPFFIDKNQNEYFLPNL